MGFEIKRRTSGESSGRRNTNQVIPALQQFNDGYGLKGEVDLVAFMRDIAYDRVVTEGIQGALIDLNTLDADMKLLFDANNVWSKCKVRILNTSLSIDLATGRQVSMATCLRAIGVKTLFTGVVGSKIFRKNL